MSTPIDIILQNNDTNITSSYTDIDIFDMTIPINTRLQYLNSIPHKHSIEIINKLNSMYSISGTTLLKEFIHLICKESNIHPTLKIECCKTLCIKTPIRIHYELLNYCLHIIYCLMIHHRRQMFYHLS